MILILELCHISVWLQGYQKVFYYYESPFKLDLSSQITAAAAKSLLSCPTLWSHRRQPTRLPCPWDSPGQNTGVGCHFLLPNYWYALITSFNTKRASLWLSWLRIHLQCRRSGLGRSPGEWKGYPLQYSGLENPMDYTVLGVTKSQTWLGDFHFNTKCVSYDVNSINLYFQQL